MKRVSGAGRPSKYKSKFCDLLIDYFSVPSNETWLKKEIIKSNGTIEREYGLKAGKLPTFSGFARANKISHDAMLEWAEGRKTKDGKPKKPKYPEFAVAYNSCKDLQREFLVDNGLAGLSPPAAYIFTAKNITNMRDKVETDITSGGQPLFVKQSYIKQAEDMKNAKSTTPAK